MRPEDFPAFTPEQFQEVLSRWEESHRGWHGRLHLATLLRNIEDAVDLSVGDREVLRYAALFHDAIYDPLSPTNEEDSARLAGDYLADYDRREEVFRIILATKSHRSEERLARQFNAWDCAILHEASLEILRQYEQGIAFEYRVIPPEVYRRERSRFLRSAAIEYENPLLDRLADEVGSIQP